jgi:hypothetical protein
MRLTSGGEQSRTILGAQMYWLDDNGPPHYVSVATGKKYFFRQDGLGEDRARALRALEIDDTPAPEPEPEAVTQVHISQRRPFDVGAQARIDLDEMRLKQ